MYSGQNKTLSFFAVVRAGFKTSIAQLKTLVVANTPGFGKD